MNFQVGATDELDERLNTLTGRFGDQADQPGHGKANRHAKQAGRYGIYSLPELNRRTDAEGGAQSELVDQHAVGGACHAQEGSGRHPVGAYRHAVGYGWDTACPGRPIFPLGWPVKNFNQPNVSTFRSPYRDSMKSIQSPAL